FCMTDANSRIQRNEFGVECTPRADRIALGDSRMRGVVGVDDHRVVAGGRFFDEDHLHVVNVVEWHRGRTIRRDWQVLVFFPAMIVIADEAEAPGPRTSSCRCFCKSRPARSVQTSATYNGPAPSGMLS